MKIRKLAVVLIGVGIMLSGVAKAESFPAGSTMETIQKKGKLVVGTSLDGPGFSLLNPTTNKAEGFEVDLARMLAKKLTGSEENVEFVPVLSQNRFAFVQTGRIDVALATATINDERKKIVSFAGPYYLAGQDVLLAKNKSTVHTPSDLNNQSVCVVTGTDAGANLLKVAPNAKLSSLSDEKGCAEGVTDGRYVALIDDGAVLVPFVMLAPDKLKILGKPFTQEPYGIVVKHGDEAFRSWVNTQIAQSITDGTWMKLYNKNLKDFGAPQIPDVERN